MNSADRSRSPNVARTRPRALWIVVAVLAFDRGLIGGHGIRDRELSRLVAAELRLQANLQALRTRHAPENLGVGETPSSHQEVYSDWAQAYADVRYRVDGIGTLP
jgi:hypothetical protein